jgi:EAL domain-containing protein (putative c-di-GMP-specific phosphodiesterase class I)
MNQPFDLRVMQVKIGVSIGISLFPDHAGDGSTLLRYADVAMYYAKRNKLQHTIYSAEIDPHTPRRLELISDLGRAIVEDQLVLHYQPKVRAANGELDGVEALVRWQHPAHGFIPPDEFVPLCEISDIIRPLTLWVLRRALNDHRRLREAGFDVGVSVNVSVRNMLDSQFPDEVIHILDECATGAEALTLEITESALMEDPRRAQASIDALHRAGVIISIDDFGTGYSSLSYLKHLPVQELKIDRGFVFDMLADDNDAVIVQSTIDLAHSLGIEVTAEGVENAAVVRRLQGMRCDYMQGFHFAKPMAYGALLSWLQAWSGFGGPEQGGQLDIASS